MNVTIDNMVEVQLSSDDDFLKVRETLTRIGGTKTIRAHL